MKKKIFKTVMIFALAVVAFLLAHKAGTAERGDEAIGGEIFVPILIIFAEDIWQIIKAPFNAVKEYEH